MAWLTLRAADRCSVFPCPIPSLPAREERAWSNRICNDKGVLVSANRKLMLIAYDWSTGIMRKSSRGLNKMEKKGLTDTCTYHTSSPTWTDTTRQRESERPSGSGMQDHFGAYLFTTPKRSYNLRSKGWLFPTKLMIYLGFPSVSLVATVGERRDSAIQRVRLFYFIFPQPNTTILTFFRNFVW